MQKPDYYDRVNEDLLKIIPPDCKVILEIGCGAGALAEAYRRVNPGVIWLGVEANQDAADRAREGNRVTDVLVDDAEEVDIRWFPSRFRPFDCLVLGDILEHLKDPWAHLDMLVDELAPGAQVLASIPNVQHFATVYNLLQGNWTYTDEGTLDRTHLRFFTLKTIRELFDQAGLQIHEIRGTRAAGDEDGWKFWQEYAKGLDIDLKQTLPLQYVVRAIKPNVRCKITHVDSESQERTVTSDGWNPIPTLHIHAIEAEACCARPRILEPFAALGTIPGMRCTSAHPHAVNPDWKADILIQQRFRSVDLVYQRMAVDLGSLLIAELDDDPESPLYTHGQPFDPMPLKAVHAVQVSTERLAELVRRWNPNVMVFENQIAELAPPRPERVSGILGIFYGAQNREADWAPIMPAINRIASEHANLWFKVVHDKAFFDALETKNKTFWPFTEYSHYREILRESDIALLPLEPTRFNECKSDIKFLECAAEGVCVLAGETAYDDSVCHPSRGHVYISPRNFEGNLRFLIDHPDVRREQVAEAYAYVRDHRMLGQHFRKRLEWYQSLLGARQELDFQLRMRVPELFRSSAPHTLQPVL